MTHQRQIGNLGEKIAAEYLTNQGYRLLEQNFRTPYGELDLVLLDKDALVFVEVKTRTSDTFGTPESSVTESKLERIYNAALLWLQEHPEATDQWRIDVIAIQLGPGNATRDIQHFINVNS